MLGYSDTNFSTNHLSPAKSPSPLSDSQRMDKRGFSQLTPLWEHVVRTRSIPVGVNMDSVFIALSERLRNPEWEVRQHALRVLVDIIPILDDNLDQKMETLLGDLVTNLGHPGPAVRKGALDCLKMYLSHSTQSDDILRNVVYKGVANYAENQIHTDVVVGIILSLPSMIFSFGTSNETLNYIVRTLANKLVQVTFQEVSLRTLVRIRDLIGPKEFRNLLDDSQARDFDLLCQVYNEHSKPTSDDNDRKWNDLNANVVDQWSDSDGVISQDEASKSDALDKEGNKPTGKVILETDIPFDKATVTMTILEEQRKSSEEIFDSDDDKDCIVKVLSDSENEAYDLRRRTPRKVRFGGEVVKLRTPDSDSNIPSDTDNEILISTTTNASSSPVIEIKFVPEDTKKGRKNRSQIPIPIRPTLHRPKARSLPTSPARKLQPKTRLIYQSHPNLTRDYFFKKSKTQRKSQGKSKFRDNATSPIPVHREIELLHNLTRSPQPPRSPSSVDSFSKSYEERKKPDLTPRFFDAPKNKTVIPLPYKSIADSPIHKSSSSKAIPLPYKPLYKSESLDIPRSKPPNVIPLPYKPLKAQEPRQQYESLAVLTDNSDSEFPMNKSYNSFVVKDTGSEVVNPDVLVGENGECLTCSSSGSEGMPADPTWETSGFFPRHVIDDMNNKVSRFS